MAKGYGRLDQSFCKFHFNNPPVVSFGGQEYIDEAFNVPPYVSNG
jgi:hypothetical protein